MLTPGHCTNPFPSVIRISVLAEKVMFISHKEGNTARKDETLKPHLVRQELCKEEKARGVIFMCGQKI